MLVSNSYASKAKMLDRAHIRSSADSSLSVEERLSEEYRRAEAAHYEKLAQLRKDGRNFQSIALLAGVLTMLV